MNDRFQGGKGSGNPTLLEVVFQKVFTIRTFALMVELTERVNVFIGPR